MTKSGPERERTTTTEESQVSLFSKGPWVVQASTETQKYPVNLLDTGQVRCHSTPGSTLDMHRRSGKPTPGVCRKPCSPA